MIKLFLLAFFAFGILLCGLAALFCWFTSCRTKTGVGLGLLLLGILSVLLAPNILSWAANTAPVLTAIQNLVVMMAIFLDFGILGVVLAWNT